MNRNAAIRLIILMMGSFFGVYHTVSLNVTLPAFAVIFHAELASVQWLVTGFALATGIIAPISGYLGERFSYRAVFLLCVAGITVTSILCSLSWSIESFIVFRVLQGLFCGLIQPVSLTLLYRWVPAANHAKVLSWWSASTVAATAVAPTLSGALQNMHWSLMFGVTVPPGIIILAAALWLTSPEEGRKGRLDRMGLTLTSFGSLSLLLLAGNLHRWGWFSPQALLLLAAGITLLAAYAKRALRVAEPLLELRLFRIRAFTVSVVLTVMLMIGLYAGTYFMPLYLQEIQGLTAMEIGLLFLPGALCLIVSTLLSGVWLERIGTSRLIVIGVGWMALSTIALALLKPDTPLLYILIGMCLRNVGIGLTFTPIMNIGMQAVPASLRGHASALIHWLRQVVCAIGLGLLSSFFVGRLVLLLEQGKGPYAILTYADQAVYTDTVNIIMWITVGLMAAVLPAVLLLRSKQASH